MTAASSRHDEAWWRRCGGVRVGGGGVLTGVAVRLGGEARKGCGRTVALGPWGCGFRCRRAHGGGVVWPHPLEHDAQPHQSDQHQLVKKEMGDHGRTPSYRWSNEGILPGLSGYRISRRIQVHDQSETIKLYELIYLYPMI